MKAKREFTVVIERDEDGYYVAHLPTLHGCYTQANNLAALVKNIREAIELCLQDGDSPLPIKFVGVNASPYDALIYRGPHLARQTARPYLRPKRPSVPSHSRNRSGQPAIAPVFALRTPNPCPTPV